MLELGVRRRSTSIFAPSMSSTGSSFTVDGAVDDDGPATEAVAQIGSGVLAWRRLVRAVAADQPPCTAVLLLCFGLLAHRGGCWWRLGVRGIGKGGGVGERIGSGGRLGSFNSWSRLLGQRAGVNAGRP